MTDLQELMALSADEERLRPTGGAEWSDAHRAYTAAARRFLRSPAFAEMALDVERLDYLISTGHSISRTGSGRFRVMGMDGIADHRTESKTARAALDAAASGGGHG